MRFIAGHMVDRSQRSTAELTTMKKTAVTVAYVAYWKALQSLAIVHDRWENCSAIVTIIWKPNFHFASDRQ